MMHPRGQQPRQLSIHRHDGALSFDLAGTSPDQVDRLVLLCPSGLSDVERLPVIDGVRRNDPRSVVASVFRDPSHTDPNLLAYYEKQFANRRWRAGLLRAVRGTHIECYVVARVALHCRDTTNDRAPFASRAGGASIKDR